MTKHSVFDAQFKAAADEPEGSFEAIVSVFGNTDLVGDRVLPGAFDSTLEKWREKGAPVPVIWSHNWGDPNAHIGFANPDDITETEKGLLVKGQLDLDNPFAAQVHKLMDGRRVTQFSFAYDVVRDRRAKDGANELVELDLIEVGPTLKGANPATELLSVKSDLEAAAAKCEQKAGRRISQATESELRSRITALRSEIDAIESLLPQEDSDDEKADDPHEPEATGIDDALLEVKTALAAAFET